MTIAQQKHQQWLQRVTDSELLAELKGMNAEQIENAFFKDLSFGTAGLRGILGAGSNCLNVYTVDKATEGIARVMDRNGQKSVAINFDSRIKSDVFAQRAATVFAQHGITVYISTDVMPVSFLSYAVRKLHCDVGVMITASHNPAIYNGYKVYESTGYQCTDYSASVYAYEINTIDQFNVQHADYQQAVESGLIKTIDCHAEYLEEVYKLNMQSIRGLSVVYSPLNGAGYKVVPYVLEKYGAQVTIVPEQALPDGNFPTCPYPNPEKRETLQLGLKLAQKINAPIVLATDPDCDRVGVAVLHNGEYVCISGNEMGALLADFVLSKRQGKTNMIYKTIVSSDIAMEIAKHYGSGVKEILTGFKYIGEQIAFLEKDGRQEEFALGYEESYGYLATPAFRDKDGVGTCYLICQMVQYYLQQGLSLVDRMNQLYDQYGYYHHETISFAFEGATGFAKMQTLLAGLRERPLTQIGDNKVVKCIDYLTQTELDIPKADVLSYYLNKAKVMVRPSGTEPLVKVYLTAVGDREFCANKIEELKKAMTKVLLG